ncbi:LacI family DNA-binding transcriptional regulator [Novosphingobium rosa]|uniref:LacI family DNA-binding transcriptional regulator n=1 Tax=Novosphingobium rosa TaxID=76978 RepID=UPI000834BC37|nr:LacI family DNA-binding transcriptional regulator [Novosphingobium rosa]
MTTIKDVAARAGVSTATVSRILANQNASNPVMRMKVMAAVNELGYAPNFAAKSLRTLKSCKIIVTVPDISNPYFSMVLRGIQDAAQPAGYSVLLGDTRMDPAIEEAYASMLLRREADGLIFLGHKAPPTLYRMAEDMGGRAPIINGGEFDCPLDISSVHIDNAQATSDMIEHLYELGHRDIAAIGGPSTSPTARERMSGIRRAAHRLRISETLSMIHTDFSIEAGERAARDLLAQAPATTAICCSSDEQAFGALSALRHHGLRCPEDISVTGFDDTRYASVSNPPLTTIHQPMVEMGRQMVTLLLGILNGTISEAQSVSLHHNIVARSSTQPPRQPVA